MKFGKNTEFRRMRMDSFEKMVEDISYWYITAKMNGVKKKFRIPYSVTGRGCTNKRALDEGNNINTLLCKQACNGTIDGYCRFMSLGKDSTECAVVGAGSCKRVMQKYEVKNDI